MILKEELNLSKIILKDLFSYYKIPLLLFCSILFSAISVVRITYQSRCLIEEIECLNLETELLEIEHSNLILENQFLTEYCRIEYIAMKNFKMQHVDPMKEKIIFYN